MAKVRIELDACQWTGIKLRKLITKDKDKTFDEIGEVLKAYLGSEDFVVVDGIEVDGTRYRY